MGTDAIGASTGFTVAVAGSRMRKQARFL